MNVHPSPNTIRRPLWVAGLFMVAAASAQVQPPGMQDRQGNEYRYPILIEGEPVVRMPTVSPPVAPDSPAAMARKLATIVIPHLEFHDTPLSDAVEQLRQESYRRDPDPDPITRGVKIAVRLPSPLPVSADAGMPIPGLPPGLPSASRSSGERTCITLTLNGIPLLEALRYVASQAGLRFDVRGDTACLVANAWPIQAMVTADFRVPPETLGLSLDASVLSPDQTSPSITIPRLDMKLWLEAKGIDFPPGACAVYLPTTRKLVVRNTQENIDRTETLLLPLLPSTTPASATDRHAVTGIIREFTYPTHSSVPVP